MSWLLLLFLILLQFISGYSVLRLFRLKESNLVTISLAFLLGIALCAIIPLLLELVFITISLLSFLVCFILITVLLYRFSGIEFSDIKDLISIRKIKMPAYEFLFIVLLGFVYLISFWRCYYLPPTARDVLVGAELLAHYAVQEGSIISSVFTEDIRISTNNLFKAPYILDLQIVYKLLGFEFGKLWLCQNVFFFLIFMYGILKQRIHPIIVGILLLIFSAIPDMYAYSFIMLYDYSNAIFFTIAVYYLHRYLQKSSIRLLAFSSLNFAIASFVRSETVYFVVIGAILFFAFSRGHKLKRLKEISVLLFPSVIVYGIWHWVFVNLYMPVDYNIGAQLNTQLINLHELISVFNGINDELIFSSKAHEHFNYFIEFFVIIFLLNTIVFRDSTGLYFIKWVLIVYFGFIGLVYLLPLVEIDNTVKRGFFKLFPIMLLYMPHSTLFSKISKAISSWESNNENTRNV